MGIRQETRAPVNALPAEALDVMPPPLPCANCGAVLSGPFCSICGQHVADYHRSLWRFLSEFFESILCWDNKLSRTLVPLFQQPGFLTREFMAGRRVRYVHPLRLFLFTSAVCLTLLQFGHDHLFRSKPRRTAAMTKDADFQWIVSDRAKPASSAATKGAPGAGETPGAADDSDETDKRGSPAAAQGEAVRKSDEARAKNKEYWVERAVEEQMAKNGGQELSNRMISQGVQRKLSWVALALLPVFALGLRAMYWRQDTYYFAHLIFSLHYHTFLLLFWTAYTGAEFIAPYLPLGSMLEVVLRVTLLLPAVYLFVALRRMYGEGNRRTALKTFVLGSTHLLTIFVALALCGAVSFFTAKGAV